ncbi:O-antigen ligase family protein [Morganella morganii]|nr:O-antigen ligase family protein [Morganella morganii]QXO46337.1 O-antigen ligase family protein [Morganella morganii]QXO50064.1 O-antigen ligase family protein [Morganella morganii]QXO53925.1 O-antigen ligase family protein [Morganella morganii]QXO80559.1 O-antigen ligase family protein [Morganella morganii]
MVMNRTLPIIIGMLMAFSMVIASFADTWSRDSYFILSYLSVIVTIWLVFFRKISLFRDRAALLVAASFLLFGISRVAWSFLMNDDGPGIYKSYSPTASRIILGAFIFCVCILLKNELRKFFSNIYVSGVIKVLPLYILLYALYDIFVLHKDRVELDTNRATVTAYLVSAIFFVSLHFCAQVKNKLNISLFFTNLIVSNAIIILTQTRAAIAVYLLLSVFYTAIVFRKSLSIKKVSIVVVLLLIFAGTSYEFLYKSRINEAITETQGYDVTKPGGSLGDRYTMWYAGLSAFKHAPFGQSFQARNDFISEKIAAGNISDSIVVYLTIHLHSELIEVLSLQGIIGGVLLVLIYLSLLYAGIRNKNLLLIMITLCLGGYGLTDVLFFSRESITVYLLCIAVALVTGGKEDTAGQPQPMNR